MRKIYTENLFARVQPVNDKFIREHTEKLGVSTSYFLDTLLDKIRTGKLKVKIVRQPTVTDIKAIERQKRMAKAAARASH